MKTRGRAEGTSALFGNGRYRAIFPVLFCAAKTMSAGGGCIAASRVRSKKKWSRPAGKRCLGLRRPDHARANKAKTVSRRQHRDAIAIASVDRPRRLKALWPANSNSKGQEFAATVSASLKLNLRGSFDSSTAFVPMSKRVNSSRTDDEDPTLIDRVELAPAH